NLTAYAVREANGHLELLVVNKSGAGALTGQFQISGFQPAAQANVWQYGEAQDTAQSHTTNGQSALANFIAPLTLNGSNFSFSFLPYSMTVIDLGKGTGGGGTGPTITQAATATPSPVTGTTTALAVAATDPAGSSSLTYTWATVGTPPAPVAFSANGTNAAHATTATFARAGIYTFQVTAADPGGLIASSSVTVIVNQSLTSIVLSPAKASVTTGGTQQFTATADDQFGQALASQPAFAWSVASGGGTIGATGLYTAPSAAGTATVKAATGSLSNTSAVTITKPTTGGLGATVAFAETYDWGAGFTGAITITDAGTTAINGWTLQFDFAGSISQIWNAQILSHVGSHYVIQNLSYDATIAPGQGVSFGFNATPGGGPTPPANYVLNGVAIPPPPPAPPAPVHASVAFSDVSDWGSGFTGNLIITNTGTAPINGWTLAFDFAGPITSIWNAQIISHIGNHYVIQDAGYDRFLSPGQSVTVGFNATPGGHPAGPANYVLS
ncbi:MAG TPA: cellulose binding domain-containing protein, partial [Isosphaeraceae bacterium]